jgi:uncharacterized protein YndB with AHSA1/START domain
MPMETDPVALYEREIVTTRMFNAPRALVWRAWTEPEHLMRWWGPNGFTNSFHEFDFRPGGHWHHTMHGPDGTDYRNESVFIEIVEPQRIVLDHLSGPRFRLTALFEELDGRAKITFRQLFESAAVCANIRGRAVRGNEENFDRLAAHLVSMDANVREVTITRSFAAPRALVWRAWTDPAHLAAWWGPNGFTNPVCEVDPRPGGAIRIVMRAPDGQEYAMRGEFREVVAPERLVFTNCAVGADGATIIDGLTIVTFAERDGGTEMMLHTRAVALVDDAIRMIGGMEAGWTQSIDRLMQHVAGRAMSAG